MESVLRHCYVMTPKEYAKASNEGDDVFLCEYEYDIHWHSFKRLADIDDEREVTVLENIRRRTIFLIKGFNHLAVLIFMSFFSYMFEW